MDDFSRVVSRVCVLDEHLDLLFRTNFLDDFFIRVERVTLSLLDKTGKAVAWCNAVVVGINEEL